MYLRNAIAFAFLLTCNSVLGQSSRPSVSTGWNLGVVVEKVKPNWEGEAAGIKAGDVLLRWTRDDVQGEIASPFDLAALEIEQVPLGQVVLEGMRGAEIKTWSPGQRNWGVETRPNVSDGMLSVYLERLEPDKSGQFIQTTGRPRNAAGRTHRDDPSWVSSWVLLHQATLFAEAKRWKEVDDTYRQAIQAAPKEKFAIIAQLHRAWGETYRQRNQWLFAEKNYRLAAAEDLKPSPQNLREAADLNATGRVAWERGDLAKAEKYLQEALAIRKKLAPESLALAQTLNDLGLVAWNRGDLPRAEQYHRQALAIREKEAPNSEAVAASYNNLGLLAWNRGDFDEAEGFFHADMGIVERFDPEGVEIAKSYMNLGLVAWERGDLARAEEYDRQALALFQKLAPNSLNLATELTNLGLVLEYRGDFAKAEAYFRQALAMKNKVAPGSLSTAQTLQCLGSLAVIRGDLEGATTYFHKALAIDEKIAPNSPETVNVLDSLGTVAGDRNQLELAKRYYIKSLAIDQRLGPDNLDAAMSLNNLGEIELRRGRLTEAEDYLRQSLSATEKRAPGTVQAALALRNLGEVARNRGDLSRAEGFHRRSLEIWEKIDPGGAEHAETSAVLARVLRQEGQTQAAEKLYAKSLDTLENQMGRFGGAEEVRLDFRAQHADIYKQYIDLLIAGNRPEAALEVAERSRAQTLLEMLARGHTEIRRGADEKLTERERELRGSLSVKSNLRLQLLSDKHTAEQIAAIDKEIDRLAAQHRELESQIRASNPSYAALMQPERVTVKQIQEKLLDEDTVLLEYSLGDERSYVWAVTPTSLSAFELPKRAEIESAALSIHRLLTAKNQSIPNETGVQRELRWKKAEVEFSRGAANLSRMILSPVAAQLAEKRLLIVSDGALQYVPFAALPIPRGESRGTPLVVEDEIVNLPSVSVLAALREEESGRQPAPMEVAILADPVFDKDDARVAGSGRENRGTGEEHDTKEDENASRAAQLLRRSAADVNGEIHLPRLRYTRQEADAIVSTAPAGKATSALDFAASREKATSKELAQYRIVHFATHGLLDNKHPELSGLVFSLVDEHGKPRNGFLELQDIYNMNLPVDLVVLSACETGMGKESNGEGLMGLTRGFMYAGASRVVASLWNVSDAATAQLMSEFYRGMEKDGMRPAGALRAAQVKMWKQKRWASPYYWGAFELQGEWK